jgi:HEAT repeat protein
MKTQRYVPIVILALLCLAGARQARSADESPELAKEKDLIAVLQSPEASLEDKAKACVQLAVVGGKDAVPVLAGMLGDKTLGDYARYAMEPMDDPSVDKALREALGKLTGRPRIGVVDSLGIRRDAKAVGALSRLVRDSDPELAAAALSALGRIATPEAAETLQQALAKGPEALRPAAANACLVCAERQLAEGKRDAAAKMYEAVRQADVPKRFHVAASAGLAAARQPETPKKTTKAPRKATKPSKARRIFDGKTFTGWEGNLEWFRIEDSAIVGGSLKKRIPRNEFLCATKEYANFEMRLKVKLVENKGNAGIQLRSVRIPNHHEMIGYQADVGRTWWGKLYDESRRRRVLAGLATEKTAKFLKVGEWNDYRIRCDGPRIQLWLNGHQTVDYTEKDKKIPRTGLIGLQIHSGAASEVWYKDIEIVELP